MHPIFHNHKTCVNFKTRVDCCMRFMGNISGLSIKSINPIIGDSIRIYHDTELSIYMDVESRYWHMINGTQPTLICFLKLQKSWTEPKFERHLKEVFGGNK